MAHVSRSLAFLAVATSLGIAGVAGDARADAHDDATVAQGAVIPELGARIGVGIRIHHDDTVAAPLVFFAGVRIAQRFHVGLEAGALLANSSQNNDGDAACPHCNPSGMRVGVAAELHLAARGYVDPWLGYGFFFEHAATDGPVTLTPTGAQSYHDDWTGICWASLRGGLDVRPARGAVGFGPFLTYDRCARVHESFTLPPAAPQSSSAGKGYENFNLGVRLVILL